eukprot:NODE_179_length_1287_cov_316.500808_g146_i0.p3 GENE.NODE_179_length_1287_cov_316.500808_g146_i0~~NODE_179_length_1287_cov_316.500808_g146_i0.p3  ORF type:complete len:93 (+),score=22.01 NODE_179_length_1287_cov_316.500808_g146_i0:232-510(+)
MTGSFCYPRIWTVTCKLLCLGLSYSCSDVKVFDGGLLIGGTALISSFLLSSCSFLFAPCSPVSSSGLGLDLLLFHGADLLLPFFARLFCYSD